MVSVKRDWAGGPQHWQHKENTFTLHGGESVILSLPFSLMVFHHFPDKFTIPFPPWRLNLRVLK